MSETYTKDRPGKGWRFLKRLALVLAVILLLAAAFFGLLTATEYKPADRESLVMEGEAAKTLSTGEEFSVMTWNIGYGALGDNADFFMDGGESVNTADKDRVLSNMDGVLSEIGSENPDILFLQETDINSGRSHHINEYEMVKDQMEGYSSSFAANFKAFFVPYPLPPIGKVHSGIATFSGYPVSEAERVQLPVPFTWPVSTVNLKRCLLVSRVPLENTDTELVLVNLHLEAYDSGEGKIAQTKVLKQFLTEEFEKGNYVIAGGDFNQVFSSRDNDAPPAQPGKWAAGWIDVTAFGGNWQFLMDGKVPSCRSLDQAYKGADLDNFQYYLIDGFIVSKNIKVEEAKAVDLGFVVSDHNPVLARLTLNPEPAG